MTGDELRNQTEKTAEEIRYFLGHPCASNHQRMATEDLLATVARGVADALDRLEKIEAAIAASET